MPSLLKIFSVFFKIGAFTLGGGYAMISLIRREVVEKEQWVDEEEFVETLAIAQSAPGPIALNTAIFVGYKARGIKGVWASALGTILPSFVIILLIAIFFADFKENPGVERVFKGIRPVVVALIAAPLWQMAKSAGVNWKNVIVPAGVALVIWGCGISPAWIVLGAVVTALCWAYLSRKKKNNS